MVSDTPLKVLDQSGSWMRVDTPDGMSGWAHSRWIYCCRVGTTVAEPSQTPPALSQSPVGSSLMTAPSCNDLWFARNQIFANRGYCFKSARGKAAFGHLPCIPGMAAGDVPLSAVEKAEVNRIRALERQNGC